MRPEKLRTDRSTMLESARSSAGRLTELSTRASDRSAGRSDFRTSRRRSTARDWHGVPGLSRPALPWHEERMRSVVQRVARAAVRVDRQVVGEVGQGLLVLLGVAAGDSDDDARWTADK